jgi:hypothetical protein
VNKSFSFVEISCSSPSRFADRFRVSGYLGRVLWEVIFGSVAGQSRWFRYFTISHPMHRSGQHSDRIFGHGREHLRKFHSDGVGLTQWFESG